MLKRNRMSRFKEKELRLLVYVGPIAILKKCYENILS